MVSFAPQGITHFLLAILVGIPLSGACAQTRPADFWHAVVPRLTRVTSLSGDQTVLLDLLANHLGRYDSSLAFEIGTGRDGIHEFIISADGIAERIPSVQALHAAAPAVPGWRIIAFRPATGASFTVAFDGYDVQPSSVWFRDARDGDKLGLYVYVPGARGPNRARAMGAAFIILDNAIGEYAVMTRIGFIEFDEPPADPRTQGLRPIADLERRLATARP